MTEHIPFLMPPSVALMGVSGAGKTYAIHTFALAGVEIYFLGTEPNAVDTLLDACERNKVDMNLVHYHQMKIAAPGWDAIEQNIKLVKEMSYETLTTQKDISKRHMEHLMEMFKACKDFPDDRTGKNFGDATSWGPSRVFVIDSLSGLNRMAREYVVGYKPTMHQGEWGVAMQLEENIIVKLLTDRNCYFVLTAHVDREVDEISGGTTITMSALGRKLAPQLVKYFSEIVLAKRDGTKFIWSTAEANAAVKNRALPVSSSLPPTFVPIIEHHRKRVRDSAHTAPIPAPVPPSTPQGATV